MLLAENTGIPGVSGGTYGVSCILPTLQDVIDYEEKRQIPQQGYPRFIPHPHVAKIQQKHKLDGFDAFAVQTMEAATHIVDHFFETILQENCRIEEHEVCGNTYAILHVDSRLASRASDNITNSGIVLNARKASRILSERPAPLASNKLKIILSKLEKGSVAEKTWCFNSGMAAIYCAVLSLLKPGKRAVVIGSCYTDSHKIFSKLSEHRSFGQTVFLDRFQNGTLPEDTGLVFLEMPSNPLLRVEDLEAITTRAHACGAIVLVDSTIGSPWHCSPFESSADWVVHSSSKSLSGKNNHLGGVLFANPNTQIPTQRIQTAPFEMDPEETVILEQNLVDFSARIAKMSKNAKIVAEFLGTHHQVQKIYLPQNLKNGNGHVISFVLKDESEQRARVFYDHCAIETKGPSMGYERTMLMPYTLITRYFDSENTLTSLGLSRYLMRLSVGTENAKEIVKHLENGLNKL